MTTRSFQQGFNLLFTGNQSRDRVSEFPPLAAPNVPLYVTLNQEWEQSFGMSIVEGVRISSTDVPLGSQLSLPGGDVDLFVCAARWPESVPIVFALGEPRPGPSWQNSPRAPPEHAVWTSRVLRPIYLSVPPNPALIEPQPFSCSIYLVLEGRETKPSTPIGRFTLT